MKAAQNAIRETTVYSCFKYSPDQRDVRASHVRDLMESMKLWGFLASKPVQVYKDGNKYVVIDGHHRLAAAKNLQIPVLFVVEAKSHADSIGQVNGYQRKWNLSNFVSMYARRGSSDYKQLAEYNRLGIPLSAAASMLSGAVASFSTKSGDIAAGNFKVKTREKIELLAQFLRDHGSENRAYVSRQFITAFELLTRVQDFDFCRLATKLANNPKQLFKTATTDQMLDQIEEIYNYHQSIKIPLAFLAKQKNRNLKPQLSA